MPTPRRRRKTPSLGLILGILAGVAVVGIALLSLRGGKGKPATKGDGASVASTTKREKSTKARSKDREARPDADTAATPRDNVAPARRGDKSPRKSVDPVAVRLITPEPGFLVEVDGVVARDDEGKVLETPCEVRLLPGTRTIRIAREKFKDIVRDIPIIEGEEIEFAPEYDPFGEPTGFFASRFALAAVGERIDLNEINERGAAWDPWLSGDGLTLWFAGDQMAGRGLYVVRRPTPYVEFGEPELVTRSTELLASPTQTQDGLLVAFGLRDKAQVRSLIRGETSEPFRSGPVLAFSEREGEVWPVVTVLADGLALAWRQQLAGQSKSYQVVRKSRELEFPTKGKPVSLASDAPRFSADGTRLYWLEGDQLLRASRPTLEAPWGEPQTVCTLPEKAFAVAPGRRQFSLSDDEVWLWGSDGPADSEALFALRIQDAPSHGPIPRGRRMDVSNRPAETPAKTDPSEPAATAEAPVDPRRATLPYPAFRRKFELAISLYDLDDAQRLLDAAGQDPGMEADREFLGWDATELGQLRSFWKRFEQKAAELKQGDSFRLRGKSVEFVSLADGVIEGKPPQGDPIRLELKQMSPVEILQLADRGVERTDKPAQLEAAVFLALSGKGTAATLGPRLQRAGEEGRLFNEHRLQRRLQELNQEAARGNIARANELVDELVAQAPKSTQAKQALAARDEFPARLVWTPVGRQDWQRPTPETLEATVPRVPGAYLISADKYRNFHLSLEWKTVGTTAQGGVYFRYPGTGDLRKAAWRIMLANDASTGVADRFATGALFGIKPPKSNRAKPDGEWNTLEVTAQGDRVRVKVNGEEVLDTPISDPNIPPEGNVCLDGEFGGITYRKVLVYELAPE